MLDCPTVTHVAEFPFGVLMRAGAAARRDGDRLAALAFFRAAAATRPDDPRPRIDLARELRDLGYPV